jgi:hypothetical protein
VADWLYDIATKTFIDEAGRRMSEATLLEVRDGYLEAMDTLLDDYATNLANGSWTLGMFEDEMRRRLRTAYVAEYTLGKGGASQMTQSDYGRLGNMLKAQYKHLRGYLDDVQSGAETRGTAGQRAKNFLGSARQGFSRGRGRAYGLDLPVHPGDGGTPCVPGETDVFAPDIEVAFERFYEGAIIELDLSNGNHLTITPNHPVLTNKGWVKAGLLYEGDYVVSHIGFDAHSRQEHDPKCSPSAIGQIFRSLPPHLRVRAKGSGMDFHGDGKEGNIDIVEQAPTPFHARGRARPIPLSR